MKSGPSALKSMILKAEKDCPAHGPYSAISLVNGIWSACPACENEERQKERTEAAAGMNAHDLMGKLKSAGIPARFINAALGTFVADTAQKRNVLKAVASYAADFEAVLAHGRCLAFVGPPGTGKTHLAAGIVREVLAGGHSAIMTTVGDYVREVKDLCWRKSSITTETEVIAKYRAFDFLVLDEVGVQFGSRTEENLIFTLIDKRYGDLKPTLVISNEESDGLETYLGPRVFDRLKENGGLIVPFSWGSARGTIKQSHPGNHADMVRQ